MDSTAVKTLTESFSKLINEASKVGTPSGNPIGVALVTILVVGAILAVGIYVIDRRSNKYRDRIERERKEEREAEKIQAKNDRDEDKREAAALLAKAELKSEQQRERDERLAREQRERDENAARERARVDQSDRDQARTNLTQFVDTVLDRFKEQALERIRAIEQRLGDMQGKVEANDRSLVSLDGEFRHMKEEMLHLKDEIHQLKQGK